MFYGRIEPKRATLAARGLFLLVCGPGLGGMTRVWAGQTPARTPPSTNQVTAQTPPPSTKDTNHQTPSGVSGKGNTPTKAVGARPLKTTAPRVLTPAAKRTVRTPISTAPATNNVRGLNPRLSPGAIHSQSPLGQPGKPSREEPTGGTKAESLRTTTPRNLPIAAGRRDPFKAFVAPSVVSHPGPEVGALPAGTRGLVISGLQLEGVVRQEPENTMIAVVTNSTKRAYFLRVNDTVYNGVVAKITPEAIYFTQNTLDSRGRAATHEVEIKLGSAPGEGR